MARKVVLNEWDGLALFATQRLGEASELAQSIFFRLAFDTCGFSIALITPLPILAQTQFALIEEQLNDGLADAEPSLPIGRRTRP